jgi:hypothetical protein
MRTMKPKMPWLIAAFLVASLADLCEAQLIRKVALSGDQAPGMLPGVHFTRLYGIGMNSDGHVALASEIAGPGITEANNSTIWSEGSGSLALVAQEGDRPPGAPEGIKFLDFGDLVPQLNDAGQIAFSAQLGDGTNISTLHDGIYSGVTGALAPVVRSGDPAPGRPGLKLNVSSDSSLYLDSDGQVAFGATIYGEPSPGVFQPQLGSIWSGDSNSLNLVMAEGDQSSGMDSGVIVDQFYFNSLASNRAGQLLIEADVAGSGIDVTKDSVIWVGNSDSLTLLVRAGDPAPGMPPGASFDYFGEKEINAAGQVAFGGGVDIGPTSHAGIWSTKSGALDVVALGGQRAPGTPAGVVFEHFSLEWIDPTGSTLFWARLEGPGIMSGNHYGLWSDISGELSLIARVGDRAPGTSDDVYFQNVDYSFVNAAGDIVFSGWLKGTGIYGGNDAGIWLRDRSGRTHLLVRESDSMVVGPGDVRTIEALAFDGLNDAGQLAFFALFENRARGIFVVDISSIPEPDPSILAIATLAAVGSLRRRR